MKMMIQKQRLFAGLLILGSALLTFRTIKMISQGSLERLALWVSALLILELIIDLACFLTSARWFITNNKQQNKFPLYFAAASTILHAIRVFIYAIGRVGPWINFDLKPEYVANNEVNWSLGWLYFAVIMSVVGLIVLFGIWRYLKRKSSIG